MIRDRLENYQNIKLELEQLQKQIADLEAVLYYPKQQKLSDMPAAPAKDRAQEELMIRHMRLQDHYKAMVARLLLEQTVIEKTIATLDDRARLVVRYKYLCGMTMAEIGDMMGYCEKQISRIHTAAMATLEAEELKRQDHDSIKKMGIFIH